MAVSVGLPSLSTEPVASLIRVLDMASTGPDTFEGTSLPQLRHQVFGGQMLAQATIAAASTLGDDAARAGTYPHSLHASFIRPALTNVPITYRVGRIRDGRTSATRRVDARQGDDTVCSVMVSLARPTSGGPAHSAPLPQVPAPTSLRDSIEIFQASGHPVAQFLGKTVAFSLRHVSGSLYVSTPAGDATTHDVWVRPRTHIPAASPTLSHALLAYVSDQIILEPVLRSLGLNWSTPNLRVASLDHAMWFHRPCHINDWHLFHLSSPVSAGGRSLARGEVYNEAGDLVASLTQEGLVRVSSDDGFWAIAGNADTRS
ncbi:thioesterase family protein [Nanchangia anserum]|uniref:Thioesterase family protein n=1 Tax=Nanchangia anserum TaxID=2692125 RepID=A0A8I0GDJ0_9ACTO|nr:acyl-CoA thioesterase domain-containing protein [Nanchangia anserum]MBD3688887.1 thioesterase family protein [Nanchangia anserum]QOX81153.1 thioesterase family protein [Nanchangia anserum]